MAAPLTPSRVHAEDALEAYWEAQEITDDTRYDFSRDMARCGHAEHLDEVRGVWIERGDLDALAAFRLGYISLPQRAMAEQLTWA